MIFHLNINLNMRNLFQIEGKNILFFEAESNYTTIHLRNGQKILSSFTLARYQEHFPGFLRINRKHLLNPEYVLRVEPKRFRISMKDNRWFIISRRRINVCII